MNKTALIAKIVEELESHLRVLASAAQASKAEATDADSRQEGQFDMRGQLAAYVAEGQSRLAADLAGEIAAYRLLAASVPPPAPAVAVGSLVTLEAKGRKSVYFLGPSGGGIDLEVAGTPVTVITALSPLGRRLLGLRAGDAVGAAGPRSTALGAVAAIE